LRHHQAFCGETDRKGGETDEVPAGGAPKGRANRRHRAVSSSRRSRTAGGHIRRRRPWRCPTRTRRCS